MIDFLFGLLQDLRKKEVGTTFNGKSESVRDVLFSPFNYFMFAAAHENGNVQVVFHVEIGFLPFWVICQSYFIYFFIKYIDYLFFFKYRYGTCVIIVDL